MKRDLFLPDRQMNRSKRAEPRLWPHERPRIAALAAVCLSVSAFLILARAAHAQELDETWTVTVGGQTAQVRADGSFVVPNVVAADLSPVDFLSDDFLRVVGTGLVNGERAYVTSEPFQIRSGAAFAVGELFFSPTPPVVPEAIRVEADHDRLEVGETIQLTVLGALADGSEVDVTSRAKGTVYRTSNPRVASVDADGLVTATGRGVAFITTRNDGATAAKRIESIRETVRIRIVGRVRLPDGAVAPGAMVRVAGGSEAETGIDGSFDFQSEALLGSEVAIVITFTLEGAQYASTVRVKIDEDGMIVALGDVLLEARTSELFGSPVLGVGFGGVAVKSADFDGDGDLDIAVANVPGLGGNVSVVLNRGDGTYDPKVTYRAVDSPVGIAIADFNADGNEDIVALGTEGVRPQLYVRLGRGDGTFGNAFFGDGVRLLDGANAGDTASAIASGDFDGDGDVDLAALNRTASRVNIVFNRGDATFPDQLIFDVGTNPRALIPGDFDGDGDLDLAVANEGTNSVSVLLNDGNGTFEPQTSFAVAPRPIAIAQGDLDGDGDLDLVTSSTSTGSVSLLLNDGSGAFANGGSVSVRGAPAAVALADLDGDGNLDLVATENGATSRANPTNVVSILFGHGDATFSPAVERRVGRGADSVDLGDVDGDGRIDILVANRLSSSISILENSADEVFPATPGFACGDAAASAALADFDGDGFLDIAVANADPNSSSSFETISTLRNLGSGSFAPRVTTAVAGVPVSIHAGDLDGDGDLDVALCNLGKNRVAVLRNDGNGSFQTPSFASTGAQPYSLALADLDSDEDLDIAAANFGFGANSVSVLLNAGDATFAAPVLQPVGARARPVALGDIDGDGDNDLLAGQALAVSVSTNRGDGSFDAAVFYPVGGEPLGVAVADLDADGDLDIAAIIPNGSTLSILRNLGDGTFAQATNSTLDFQPRSLTTGDLDGDGAIDLITVDFDHTITVLRNRGDGTFEISHFATGGSEGGIATGDLDGDGDVDVVASGGGMAWVFLNRTRR